MCAVSPYVQTIVQLDTIRESALEGDWEKNPLLHQGLEPTSALPLAFQSDALPTELFPPSVGSGWRCKSLNAATQSELSMGSEWAIM